jgi:TolB protein
MRRFAGAISVLATTSVVLFAAQPAYGTFPGKNGRIAFRRQLGEHRAAIFTVNPDGTHERQLTNPPRRTWTTEPNWSPSGRWIVYNLWRHADQDNARIFKIRPNGTHRTALDSSCAIPCETDSFPAWSPSGTRIVFGRGLGPSLGTMNLRAIFIMRTDGSHVRQLTQVGADLSTPSPYEDDHPSWSPDGTRIAFQRRRQTDDSHAIFTVRLDGTHLRRLTPWKLDCAFPDWSPSGRWIALHTDENSDVRGAIGLVRPSGKHLHLITRRRPRWGLLSFSPDGRQIASDQEGDLYRMRVNGSHVRLVVDTPKGEGIPGWGPRPK